MNALRLTLRCIAIYRLHPYRRESKRKVHKALINGKLRKLNAGETHEVGDTEQEDGVWQSLPTSVIESITEHERRAAEATSAGINETHAKKPSLPFHAFAIFQNACAMRTCVRC